MDKTELNECSAISRLMAHGTSTGYRHAVEEHIPVTYLSGTDIVCEQDGNRTVVAHVATPDRLDTPKTIFLK